MKLKPITAIAAGADLKVNSEFLETTVSAVIDAVDDLCFCALPAIKPFKSESTKAHWH